MIMSAKEKLAGMLIQCFRWTLLEERRFKQGHCALIFHDSTEKIRKVGATEPHSSLITTVFLMHRDLQSLAFIWKAKLWFSSRNCVLAIT